MNEVNVPLTSVLCKEMKKEVKIIFSFENYNKVCIRIRFGSNKTYVAAQNIFVKFSKQIFSTKIEILFEIFLTSTRSEIPCI